MACQVPVPDMSIDDFRQLARDIVTLKAQWEGIWDNDKGTHWLFPAEWYPDAHPPRWTGDCQHLWRSEVFKRGKKMIPVRDAVVWVSGCRHE